MRDTAGWLYGWSSRSQEGDMKDERYERIWVWQHLYCVAPTSLYNTFILQDKSEIYTLRPSSGIAFPSTVHPKHENDYIDRVHYIPTLDRSNQSTNAATAPNPATNPPTTTLPAAFEGLVTTPVAVGATEGFRGPFGVAVANATDVTGNTPVGAGLTPGVMERNCVELISAPAGAVLGP